METNYVFSQYDFPLPNNGERYDLSQEELIKILDHVYDCGYKHGSQDSTPLFTTVASTDKDYKSEI